MSAFYDKILSYQAQNKVYIIAEVGSNWKTKDDLMGSVNLARNCGADAVKFQYFTPSELYGPTPEIDQTFPLRHLKEKADAAGLDFLCTAFSPQGFKEVDKFVDAHKIASSEMAYQDLLKVARATGKPILLSTGGYFVADIERSLKFLQESANYPVIPLHCNHAYPAKFTDLKKWSAIKAMWNGPMGFSDHTTSIDLVPVMYKNLGACVYEKHFNPYGYTDTPDALNSLNREEFKAMVSYLRGEPNDYNEETKARLQDVRRIIALKDLRTGDRFIKDENIGVFRVKKPDARGVSPFAMDRLDGKIVAQVIKKGDGVSLSDAQ